MAAKFGSMIYIANARYGEFAFGVPSPDLEFQVVALPIPQDRSESDTLQGAAARRQRRRAQVQSPAGAGFWPAGRGL